jgi:DNA processing protein
VAIAVVGTRNCTPYGEGCAKKLGHELSAAGAVVVSGLAKGIDAAATHGALMAGGVTVGVVGNGLDVRYPYESRFLYDDVAAAGVLLSEYPPGAEAAGWHFPARNRILSGLCVGTLVVEAPLRSGALITAETALEQGRDVFVVPGPIDAENSAGCNRLIQEGALLVTGAEDILREYEGRYPQKLRPRAYTEPPKTVGYQARQLAEAKPVPPSVSLSRELPELSDDQLAILRLLGEEPMQVDDIIELTELPTRRVLSALTVLEMDELVTQHSGKRYTRAVTLTE